MKKNKNLIISIVFSIVLIIAVSVSIILFTDTGFILTKSFFHHTIYTGYVYIDDFNENDFEIIKNTVISDNQSNLYYLDKENKAISRYIDDTSTLYTKTANLSLNDDVKRAISNIAKNKELDRITFIEIHNEYVEFDFELTGCAIVCTDNIRYTVDDFEQRSIYGDKYACKRLSGNWYTIYR